MEKPADTRYPIHELLARRWSPHAFADAPVEAGTLARLFEAARWAPSSFNEQPWSFIVGSRADQRAHEAIADCLVEGNRAWAAAAPVLLMSLAKLTFERNGEPNRHAYHDLGLAVGAMLVEATGSGLVAHQMAGFDVEKARTDLQIPEGYDPVAVIAVGYPGDAEGLPEDLRKRELAPRSRRDLGEFVFRGTFGNPMSFD